MTRRDMGLAGIGVLVMNEAICICCVCQEAHRAISEEDGVLVMCVHSNRTEEICGGTGQEPQAVLEKKL